jgi:hypothetical protein
MQGLLFEMAFDRSGFKNKLFEFIHGAAYEYLIARLFQINGQTKWVEHKLNEVDRLLTQAELHILEATIKGKWNRKTAAKEVLADLREKSFKYAMHANDTYKVRYFKSKPVNPYDEKSFAVVWQEFEVMLKRMED